MMTPEEFKKQVVATFNTQAGEELLKFLANYYLIDTPVAPTSSNEGQAKFREGENNIIRMFLNIMRESDTDKFKLK